MVWSEIVWFQIMNLMVWVGSEVGQSADVDEYNFANADEYAIGDWNLVRFYNW